MSQNQEIIEAKLCAYVDGELDAEGRAEIEKHLEANPQHRRLLESLRATRDLLRWLPREPAPAEIAETLNGQLERSVLLNYDAEFVRPRIGARILAMAAIITLTAGLAAAVYVVLPRSSRNTRPFAIAPSPRIPAPAAGDLSDHVARDKDENETVAKAGLTQRLEKGGTPVFENQSLGSAKRNSGPPLDSLRELAARVAGNPDAYLTAASSNSREAGQPESDGDSIVMLVRSDNPRGTQKQLATYFEANQIEWQSADEANANGAGAAATNSAAEHEQMRRSQQSAVAAPQAVGRVQQQPPAPAEAVPPATQPGQTNTQVQNAQIQVAHSEQNASINAQVQNAAAAPQVQQEVRNGFNYDRGMNNNRGSNAYVARMSRRQAEILNTICNEGSQRAQVQSLGANFRQDVRSSAQQQSNLSQEGTSTGANATTLAEGPGQQTAAATKPATDFSVHEAPGSTTLPALTEPPPQSPLTGGATVGRGVGAATQSSDLSAADALNFAKAPQRQRDAAVLRERMFGAGASGRPGTEPTTLPADEPVTVVIVVQPAEANPAGPATTGPSTAAATTQPAATEASH